MGEVVPGLGFSASGRGAMATHLRKQSRLFLTMTRVDNHVLLCFFNLLSLFKCSR